MIARANDSNRSLLLILPSERRLHPLAPVALTRAQSSRRRLRNAYADALLLDDDGHVRRFEHIEVLGPWGDSFGRKVLSRLTDAWNIRVTLSNPLPLTLVELKKLIADCAVDSTGDDSAGVFTAEALAGASSASTGKGVLDALDLPPPEEALDVL